MLHLSRRAVLGALGLGCALLVARPGVTAVDVDEIAATPLERGLAAIVPGNIAADLSFIASDELRGRDTPSPELEIAARFIRARLQRLGFEPGAPRDSFFYEYELAYAPLALDRSQAGWQRLPAGESGALRLGRDYWIGDVAGAAEETFAGEVVFCGYGRKADFAANARGKWALCLDDGKGAGRRAMTARRAGVLGLITFPASDYDGDPYAERFASVMSVLERGRVRWPGGRQRSDVFPSVFVERAHGLALLAAAGRPEDADESWTPAVGAELPLRFTEQRHLADADGLVEVENVCGFWPGRHPERSKEVVILSAHYDHVGARGDDIFNGADDNGTGTTGLLALAEALAAHGPLERSVLLIWVSGEEKGLLGSKAWALRPWLPAGGKPVANINIDMIGRNDPAQLLYTPTAELEEYYNGLAQVLERHAAAEGFTDLGSADGYYHRSDQASFETLGIPVMFLFADVHEDYHQATDTAEKIDTDKVARVARLVLRMLVDLDDESIER